jgi:hypothetical protein
MVTRQRSAIAAVLAAAGGGIVLEATSPGVRGWLFDHPFSNAVLVGVLLISATYLVVERALEERERRRWSEAAGPLLQAIAGAGAGTDAELRAKPGTPGRECEWLGELLERYQGALTGTPELIEHWHAALSLVQHARVAQAQRLTEPDAAYEAAWTRFRATFADVHDFAAETPGAGATWAAVPAVPRTS